MSASPYTINCAGRLPISWLKPGRCRYEYLLRSGRFVRLPKLIWGKLDPARRRFTIVGSEVVFPFPGDDCPDDED